MDDKEDLGFEAGDEGTGTPKESFRANIFDDKEALDSKRTSQETDKVEVKDIIQ